MNRNCANCVKSMWNPNFNTRCEWELDGFFGLGWAVIPDKQEYGFCRHQRFYTSHAGGALGASSVILILPPHSDSDNNCRTPPRGVVVAMTVNMVSVRLNKMALEIAKLFEQMKPASVTEITDGDKWAKSKL